MERPNTQDNDRRITEFLNNRFGYARVSKFLENPKKGLDLNGTIMGSYGKGIDYNDSFEGEDITWRRKYPLVSRVYPTSELDRLANEGKGRWYLQDQMRGGTDYRKLGKLREEIKSRQFFIANGLAFLGNTSNQIKELAEQTKENLPGSVLDYSPEDGFSVLVTNPDFCFYSGGQRTKDSNKVVAVSFNLNQEAVDELNGLVKRYSNLMRTITSKKTA